MGEAVAECVSYQPADGSLLQPAMTLTSVLLAGQPKDEDLRTAEAYLAKAAEKHKDNAKLLVSLGNLRVAQNRIPDAEQLFERAIQLEPNNVLTLNNLATIQADQPTKLGEALKHIERAIDLAGPQAGLADTKGYVLLQDGKADQAVSWFQEAVRLPNPDPRYRLHLAAAYLRMGKKDEARGEFGKVRPSELSRQIMTPAERAMLEELAKQFPGKAS
jgi:Flp pilus assembly protein TadD